MEEACSCIGKLLLRQAGLEKACWQEEHGGRACSTSQVHCWSATGGDLQLPGKTPAEARMEGDFPQENVWVEHAVSKVGEECSCCTGSLCVGAYKWEWCEEKKWQPPALLLLEMSCKDPCPSSTWSEICK